MVKLIRSTDFPELLARMVFNVRIAVAAAILAACAATFGAHSAGAAAITLGTASNYGVLLGASDTLKVTGALAVTGNLGLGNNDTLAKSGANSVSDNEYHDSKLTVTGGGLTVSGSTVTQSMSSILTAAASASTSAAALTATAGMVDQGGSISLNGSSVTIKALTNLSENVLDISALSLTNGTLTFDDNGFTGAKFIINVTGGFSVGNSAIIKGINGASGADIIFNIEGTNSNAVSLTGNSTTSVIGTILAPQRSVTLGGGGSLTGAIIAGANSLGTSGYTVQNTSGGYNITTLGYAPRTVVNTPEPSSIALFGAGMFALIGVGRRLRRPPQQS
jgi:choice-of-anchor A domain-containing protein